MVPFVTSSTTRSSRHVVIYELIMVGLLIILLVTALIGVTTGWVVNSITVPHAIADQKTHLAFAMSMFDSGKPPIAHFLYQASVIGLHLLVHDSDWLLSAILANLLPQVFVGIIIYIALRIGCRDVEKNW